MFPTLRYFKIKRNSHLAPSIWDPNGKTKIEENMRIGHQKGFHLIVNSIEEAKNTNSTLQPNQHSFSYLVRATATA